MRRCALCDRSVSSDPASGVCRGIEEWGGVQDLSGASQIALAHQNTPTREWPDRVRRVDGVLILGLENTGNIVAAEEGTDDLGLHRIPHLDGRDDRLVREHVELVI
jgi:hypothetical protein